MVGWILKKILGSKNQRELKRLMPIVRRINEFDEQFKSLSDDELRRKRGWKEEISKIPELQDQWKKLMKFAGSIRGGEKRGAPAERSATQLHGVRSADGLGHGALRRAIARRYRFAQGPNRGDGDRRR
jgi:preprotein translocase subunit SecA